MIIVGIILILIGLSALIGLHFFTFIFAVVLIVIGVRLVMRRSGPNGWFRGDWHPSYNAASSHEDFLNEVVVFSPLEKKIISENFRGGKVVAVFSSAEIDLTQAKVTGNTIDLNISSTFSSVNITIPKEWTVRSSAQVFLGKIDLHQPAGSEPNVTVNLHGEAIFAEIHVRRI